MRVSIYFFVVTILSCSKTDSNSNAVGNNPSSVVNNSKPKADFNSESRRLGFLPDTIVFKFSGSLANTFFWDFGNGATSTLSAPEAYYNNSGTYQVKLIVTNSNGSDSIVKPVVVRQDKPVASFQYTNTSIMSLPVTIVLRNNSIGSGVSYRWVLSNGLQSTQVSPTFQINQAGATEIKLYASNSTGTDSTSSTIKIPPYPQSYVSFNNQNLNLYLWEGERVSILSRSLSLNRTTMARWLIAMDSTYNYYKICTGRDPGTNLNYVVNGRTTIADVPSTCGAGCGFLGSSGIEIRNDFFDIMYNAINSNNQFDQVAFYEFGRNFWFYNSRLAYKTNDPIATGYAVFMRFLSMEYANIVGAPFNGIAFSTFRSNVENLINTYLANNNLNWENTLGANQGIPGSGLGATDLFASFCFRLRREYGGESFVRKLWLKAGERPSANSTQDAVDNFFLAACGAANRNLTSLFQTWRWPLSSSAINVASQYP